MFASTTRRRRWTSITRSPTSCPGFTPSQARPVSTFQALSAGKRVAIDPGTGAVAPVAYIGLYVPNSGNPADGFQLLGANGVPLEPYTSRRSRLRLASALPTTSPVTARPRCAAASASSTTVWTATRCTTSRARRPSLLPAGQLHHVCADRIQRQQPGIRSCHLVHVALRPTFRGTGPRMPASMSSAPSPGTRCWMLAIPATGVTTSSSRTTSTRFRSARALPSTRECGCHQRQQDAARHPSANRLPGLQHDQRL